MRAAFLLAAILLLASPVWPHISAGLTPSAAGAFTAPGFDSLDDGPQSGLQESLRFSVRGVPHHLTLQDVPVSVSRPAITGALESIVTAAAAIFGAAPCHHYTFRLYGRGDSLTTPEGFTRGLSVLAREYFHTCYAPRLRPRSPGPPDSARDNRTPLLWVTEGLTVYYQDILLLRAALISRQQYLDRLASSISAFENTHQRNYQSADEASPAASSNGAVLGALLDLNIRAASGNRRSLDDVLRALYARSHGELSADEFRAECDRIAGSPSALDAVFAAASSTVSIDYAAHFRRAGIVVEVTKEPAAGIYSGLHTSTLDLPDGPALSVTDAAPGSPAASSNLKPGDRILSIDGRPASAAELHAALQSRAPGQPLVLRIRRAGAELDVQLYTAPNFKRAFRLIPDPGSTWPELGARVARAGRSQEKMAMVSGQ